MLCCSDANNWNGKNTAVELNDDQYARQVRSRSKVQLVRNSTIKKERLVRISTSKYFNS